MPQNQSLTIKPIEGGKPGKVYYPLHLNTSPVPTPGPGQVLVKVQASALNHRDLFIRQHLYPGISFSAPLLADGYGTVVSPSSSPLYNKPVLVTPSRGWISSPDGPEPIPATETNREEKEWSVIGGSARYSDQGTAQSFIVVPEEEVFPAPGHLTSAEGAALPLAGLTAWRALITKGEAERGQNVLVTGIGGGVALAALQFAVKKGCNVYVTSSSQEKINKALEMGAKGGVLYTEATWEKTLLKQLPKTRPFIDVIVDGSGGDIVAKGIKMLKQGGKIVVYGMTVGPKMEWNMNAVLKNIELRGTSMGSRAEFGDMVKFVDENKIKPVVSRVVSGGLENIQGIDGLFEDLKGGKQFGKLVILVDGEEEGARSPKL
ncbi:uncharacterized protein PODANS_1_24020 [Podospora anserina S mat+]|uniref:Podospora anserina S mat+ genomic DNA chromosome 1, supercontig 6 n=1 Tax=Podospora anserina (strain S / ATCC MYA-4624 / DSM 980 / FGSC 10383) TaxID=515849 RepID=B2ASM8_PODAN|nr:uncharacterized protein PODANS_1_24020 [Podospora anserina S mat+]CAP67401.1 unnamed protein product [Podospora anserina S mat+]CDP24815.1 Putative quinone oxidoreductase [Podospora anserina S mat+]